MRKHENIPIVIIVLLSPFLIFIIGLIIWAATFRAGPIKKVSEISVHDFYYKEKISIKLQATNYAALGGYDTFDYDGTLREILQATENMTNKKDTYKAEIINDILLVTKINDKVSYCAIRKLAKEKRYLITDMAAEIKENNSFLFPYHFYLKETAAEDKLVLHFSETETIKTTHDYYNWKSFYAKLSRPEIIFDDESKKINLGMLSINFIGEYEIGFEK